MSEKHFRRRADLYKRYPVSRWTLSRWMKDPSVNFPKPMLINGIEFWGDDVLDAFDAARAAACDVA